MRYLWWVGVIAILSGCIPYSDNPLTVFEKEGLDPAILGTWSFSDKDETVFLHMGIDRTSKGLRVVIVEFHKDGEVAASELVGHTSRVGDNSYMNLRWVQSTDSEAGYIFWKYQIVEGRIGLGMIRSDTVEQAIREGRIGGKIDETQSPRTVRLTDSSKQLRDYVEKHDATLFEELQWMNRVN